MTEATLPADPARAVRRLLGVAVAAAMAAGVGALVLAVTLQPPRPAPPLAPRIFPERLAQGGATLRLGGFVQAPREVQHLSGQLHVPGRTVRVAVRCDSGVATVVAGAATATQPCAGRGVLLFALGTGGRGVPVHATVSVRQRAMWGVAGYR